MHRFIKGGLVALACLAVAPVMAADYPFSVTNKTQVDLLGIRVEKGQINDFKRIADGSTRNMTISLADGVCVTRVVFSFADSDSLAVDDYDACNGGGIDVGN